MKKQHLITLTFSLIPYIFTAQTKSIWTERNVVLSKEDCKKPVVVAIWTNGVDVKALPSDNIWVNPKEKQDQIDNDDNNCIDDIHGITFYGNSADNKLFVPIILDSSKLKRIDSLIHQPNLSDLKCKYYETEKKMESMLLEIKAKAKGLAEDYGTIASGLVIEGNKSVRIMTLRISAKPSLSTIESMSKDPLSFTESIEDHKTRMMVSIIKEMQLLQSKAVKDIGNYIRMHQVKIVNMSALVPTKSEISNLLSVKSIDEKLKIKLIEEIYSQWRSAISECIGLSINTLFIIPANISKNDPYFFERFPTGYKFSNIFFVGAVNDKGNSTNFTCKESNVEVYANGYEVETMLQGGAIKKFSSSVLGAPQVTNLAAKILAINPNLSPLEIKNLIIRNSDRNTEGLLLINPKKTIEKM